MFYHIYYKKLWLFVPSFDKVLTCSLHSVYNTALFSANFLYFYDTLKVLRIFKNLMKHIECAYIRFFANSPYVGVDNFPHFSLHTHAPHRRS